MSKFSGRENSGVHEECGIFGVIQKDKAPLAREVYYGLFALQHRGQESAGIAVNVPERRIAYYKNMGLVNEVFSDEELALLPDRPSPSSFTADTAEWRLPTTATSSTPLP